MAVVGIHRYLHSLVRCRSNKVVYFIILATELLKNVGNYFEATNKVRVKTHVGGGFKDRRDQIKTQFFSFFAAFKALNAALACSTAALPD